MIEFNDSPHACDILIPTFNNFDYLGQCVNSILTHTMARQNMRIIVINNGEPQLKDYLTQSPFVKIIQADKNLGWEGGLKLGLQHSTAPIVCLMNDDTFVPFSSHLWLVRCLSEFRNLEVAAVGPVSNVVRGAQNIFLDQFGGYNSPYAPFLIGFCKFVRRSDLDAAGGIDDTLPGGDDFDLSMRLKKLGKKLVICRDVFVYHHGFKTGVRVKGGPEKKGGWNSKDMTENTNIALIRKHGFRSWVDCNYGSCENPNRGPESPQFKEQDMVRKYIKPGIIYDLGCGASKTVPEAIGIDRVLMEDDIPCLENAKSQADVQGDVSQELPFDDASADTIIVRHILEHCIDTVQTLKNWIKKLKPDGRLIIAVPDERFFTSIPMNPEHRHAFTPESLENILSLLGMKKTGFEERYNGVSFTSCFEKTSVSLGVVGNGVKELSLA